MRPSGGCGAAAQSGFTLLEVLVAVGVLGLLYTVLAGVAMQGLRAEGESARELRASLLADRALAEVELGGDLGVVPPIEREEEEFVVVVEVAPFELALPPSTRGDGAERGRERVDTIGSLIHRGRGSRDSALRRIDVSVTWTEGVAEREVRRTSFALDPEAAAPLLESLAASQAGREPTDEDEIEDEDEDEDASTGGDERPTDGAPRTGTPRRSRRSGVPTPGGGDE